MKQVIYRGYRIFSTMPLGHSRGIKLLSDEGVVENVFAVEKLRGNKTHDGHIALTVNAAKRLVDALVRAEKAKFGPEDQDLVDIVIEDEFTNHTTEKRKKPKSKGFTVTRMIARLARESERSFDARDIQRYIWKQKCVKVKITTVYAALQLCKNRGIICRVGRGTYRRAS